MTTAVEQSWTLRTPADVRRVATLLFDQQEWCWGQDVRRPEGNLLIRAGCERLPPPAGLRESSRYRLSWSAACRFYLHGHGVFVGDDLRGGIWLRRFDYRPQWTTASELPPDVWNPDGIADLHPPDQPGEMDGTLVLLSRLLNWIVHYEQDVLDHLGVAYRERCLAGFRRPQPVPPERIVELWQAVSAAAGAVLPRRSRIADHRVGANSGD